MIFQYQALDRNGDSISDYIDAPSETTARQKIRSQGLYLVKLKKQDVAGTAVPGEKPSAFKDITDKITQMIRLRRSKKEVGLFSRQLSTLLKAGLPLPVAITDIVEQIDNKHFRNIIADIKEKIEEGSSFSNALMRHKSLFSDMYISMVRVGENLGSLDQVVERLADIEEKRNILTSKIRSVLYYPAFMMFFAFFVLTILMTNVIPSIAEMFKEQDKSLPVVTSIVIGVSKFLSTFWFVPIILVLVLIYVYSRYVQTEKGRRKVDEIKLKMPLFKNLYHKLITLRFTQNLGVLLSNNVDIIKSFEIVEKIVGNVIIEDKISDAAKKIREGSSVANALNKGDFLPKLVIGMITAGEASDNLDKMLLNIGNVYETELDLTISGLTSLIEPLIIIVMGLAIGAIVMSVMLPIIDMNALIE